MKLFPYFLLISLALTVSLLGDWAEKTLKTLTIEEKIGQLFIIPACPKRGKDHKDQLLGLIKNSSIGGLILKQATPLEQITLINTLQTHSTNPLICLADAEWGLGMRMDETLAFPKNLTLGAISNLDILYELGFFIGNQCKEVGIHINLAPVVDVNNNPFNPIIHMRSFGENPDQVAKRASKVAAGMEAAGIISCAKHFPGHGDVSVDSHLNLPEVAHANPRLESTELFPFKFLAQKRIGAIMSAHLLVPALDPTYPATLSKPIIQDLLINTLKYQGLVITDALNMKGITSFNSKKSAALLAFLAGHHLLLYGDHIHPNIDEILIETVPKAIQSLKTAYEEGILTESLLDERVLKILQVKERLGLHQNRFPTPSKNFPQSLLSKKGYSLRKALFRSALTLYRNDYQMIPMQPDKDKKIALIQVGKSHSQFLEKALKHYADVSWFSINEIKSKQLKTLNSFDSLIIAIYGIQGNASHHFNLKREWIQHIIAIQNMYPETIIALFGTPYSLSLFPEKGTYLVGYEEAQESEEGIADILFGKLNPSGHLPITVSTPQDLN